MDNRNERERKRLRTLSFPVDAEHMERFSSYLDQLGLAPKTKRDLYRAMQRFGRSYSATSKTAHAMHLMQLDGNCESMTDSFRSAYHHYQRMCESEYQPGEPLPTIPDSDPKPDVWTPYGLKPGHPARVLCKRTFDGSALKKINFRQIATNEWRFEGDEFLYRVRVCPEECTLTVISKVTGKCWMHRKHPLHPDGTINLHP